MCAAEQTVNNTMDCIGKLTNTSFHSTQPTTACTNVEKTMPMNFPDGVLTVRKDYDPTSNGESQKYDIHPTYRDDESAFVFFATTFLPLVNNSFNNFKHKKGKKVISEIFTVSDEAYALLMLINDLPGMDWRKRGKPEEEPAQTRKPFTSGDSGDQTGLNEHGRKVFGELHEQLRALRKTSRSKELKESLRSRFRANTRTRRGNVARNRSQQAYMRRPWKRAVLYGKSSNIRRNWKEPRINKRQLGCNE